MSLQNESLNFELFTKLPSPPSSSLLTPFVAVSPPARPLAAHAPCLGQNRLLRPWYRSKPLPPGIARSCHAPRGLSARHAAERRHRSRCSCPRVAVPLLSPLLKLSSSVHDAKPEFASSSPRARARARAPCARGAARHRHGSRARLVVASPPPIPFSPN